MIKIEGANKDVSNHAQSEDEEPHKPRNRGAGDRWPQYKYLMLYINCHWQIQHKDKYFINEAVQYVYSLSK